MAEYAVAGGVNDCQRIDACFGYVKAAGSEGESTWHDAAQRNTFTILECRAGKWTEWNLCLQAVSIGADDSDGVFVRQGNIDRAVICHHC
jgi:hypothetical protein